MLYDRPVADLMADAVGAQQGPFRMGDIVGWFQRNFPKVKASTVRAHVTGMTANNPSRHHMASSSKPPLMVRRPDGLLERFDPDLHEGLTLVSEDRTADEDAEQLEVEEARAEFALEGHLEAFLLTNWKHVNWGRRLALWQDGKGSLGHQLPIEIGRLDFLCRDESSNALVVIELKRGRPSDRVVGQIARYMGWLRAHLAAPGQAVEGIIVAHEADDPLRYAVAAVPGLSILTYGVTFKLTQAPLAR